MNLPSKFRETCRVGRLKLSRPSREEVCADISGSNEIKFRISAQIEKHIDHMRVHYSVLPQPDHPSRKSLEPAVMTVNCRLSLACAWQSFLLELRAALGRLYRHRLHRAPAQHHAAAQALRQTWRACSRARRLSAQNQTSRPMARRVKMSWRSLMR